MKLFKLTLCSLVITTLLFATGEIKEELEYSRIVTKVPTTKKVVALTFDDGPSLKTTEEILAILDEKKVKATFFVLGQNVELLPGVLAQEIEEGHEVGIHSYDHRILSKISKDDVKMEIEKSEKLIAKATVKPTLFRPPGGSYNKSVLSVVKDKGYTMILWSVDPHDWSKPSAKKIVDVVMSKIKPGSIILLHDLKYPSPTPEAVSIIIDRLKEQGYEFVTVSELLKYYEIQAAITSLTDTM
ncbi:Peptidoglycan-N-acetylglucosamine deacetylase [Sporomusa rhizae]|uniref:polysaccharide deacetylase family protein n=1 Tax=Sporomusa rhizae TaxID=357999 RepID=UPI00352A8230